MSRSLINAAAVLALPALGLFGLAPSADAAVIYGLTENNNVFRIDSDIPETIQSAVFVQGLEGAELLNIDFRPSTGQLYALTTDNRILTLNPDTGAVTSSQTLSTPLNGTSFGFDFDPSTDSIRIVSDTRQNLSVNPATGVATVQSPLTPDSNIVGAAYDNILGGATTLYTIDSLADTLNTQDGPGGNQTVVGNLMADDLHIDATNRVGFDIGPDNQAFAAFNEIDFALSDLYTVDLSTGAIEFVGQFGGGFFVRDIAVVVPEPATAGLLAVGALLAVRRRRA